MPREKRGVKQSRGARKSGHQSVSEDPGLAADPNWHPARGDEDDTDVEDSHADETLERAAEVGHEAKRQRHVLADRLHVERKANMSNAANAMRSFVVSTPTAKQVELGVQKLAGECTRSAIDAAVQLTELERLAIEAEEKRERIRLGQRQRRQAERDALLSSVRSTPRLHKIIQPDDDELVSPIPLPALEAELALEEAEAQRKPARKLTSVLIEKLARIAKDLLCNIICCMLYHDGNECLLASAALSCSYHDCSMLEPVHRCHDL